LLRQRKAVQAGEILQKSLAGGNRSVEAIKLLAQVKLALGEWEQAEQLAKQLQSVEGQEALSQQILGAAYQGKDEQGASIEAFKRAHELAPDASQPVVALVQTYVRSGKPDEARRFLESILAVDADNVTAHLLLGQLSLAEQAPAEAIKHFNAIVDSNPELEIGYRSLTSAYLGQNDTGAAESVMNKGIAAMPGNVALSMGLASIYERQGEFDKAIDLYQSLLEKNDDLLVAKNNLASLLTDYRGDPASLEQARTIAAELRSSQIPQFLDTYAWASVMASTNLEEAIVILEGVVKENGQVDVYAYHLGEAYRRKGDAENAMTYLSKAVEIAEPGSDVAVKANASLAQLK
jgi:tetratricopeptide (TPR) repeat protein